MKNDYCEILAAARAAAETGAALLREKWGQTGTVHTKKRFDYVTDADRAAEEAILGSLFRNFPQSRALAEESATKVERPGPESGLVWVVDPLDGTTNFIHQIPHVAVSVAAYLDGQAVAGVVADVTKRETFTAQKGGGAFVNDRPLAVSPEPNRDHWLIATGFPWRDKDKIDPYLQLFAELFTGSAGARRAGAAALDMAYVAAGRVQGFFEISLAPWDLAAGDLLVREAGGMVSDFDGGDQAVWRGDVAAAAPQAHPWLWQTCHRHLPGGGR